MGWFWLKCHLSFRISREWVFLSFALFLGAKAVAEPGTNYRNIDSIVSDIHFLHTPAVGPNGPIGNMFTFAQLENGQILCGINSSNYGTNIPVFAGLRGAFQDSNVTMLSHDSAFVRLLQQYGTRVNGTNQHLSCAEWPVYAYLYENGYLSRSGKPLRGVVDLRTLWAGSDSPPLAYVTGVSPSGTPGRGRTYSCNACPSCETNLTGPHGGIHNVIREILRNGERVPLPLIPRPDGQRRQRHLWRLQGEGSPHRPNSIGISRGLWTNGTGAALFLAEVGPAIAEEYRLSEVRVGSYSDFLRSPRASDGGCDANGIVTLPTDENGRGTCGLAHPSLRAPHPDDNPPEGFRCTGYTMSRMGDMLIPFYEPISPPTVSTWNPFQAGWILGIPTPWGANYR